MDQDLNKRFWDWFTTQSRYIEEHLETDTENIALDIKTHLKEVDDSIEFEIPFEFDTLNRPLIISADGDYQLFGKVIKLVESAPSIDGWDIVAFRPRLHQRNQVIDLDGLSLDYHDIYFTYKVEDLLYLEIYIDGYDGIDQRYVHLYFLLLDSLIGEFDSVTLIKETTVHSLKEKNGLCSFPELIMIVDQLKKKQKVIKGE